MVFVSYLGLSFLWVQGGLGIDFDDCAPVKLERLVLFSGCDMGLCCWVELGQSVFVNRVYFRDCMFDYASKIKIFFERYNALMGTHVYLSSWNLWVACVLRMG